MRTDFEIKHDIYLVKDQYELDLHNDFDFQEVRYSVAERRASLHWKRGTGEWVNPTTPASLRLEFLEISEFRFLPRDSELPFTEDDCLHAAGHWTDEEWCTGVFMNEADADPGWLTAFEFMSGAIIALRAEQATAVIEL